MNIGQPVGRTLPWYRHRWPWLLILPPLGAVLASFGLLYQAINSPNPMVVDDYASIARHTERRMERDRRAAELGVKADLTFSEHAPDPTRRELLVEVNTDMAALPDAITLRWLHPTLSTLDRQLVIQRDGYRFRTTMEPLPEGRYYLQLEPDTRDWRLVGETQGDIVRLQLSAGEHR